MHKRRQDVEHRKRTAVRRVRGAMGMADALGGADPYVAAFEQGPFAGLALDDVPPGVLAIVQRRHGNVTAALVQDVLRAWLFAGLELPQLSGQLRLAQWLTDPHPDRALVEAAAPTPAPELRHAGDSDTDLHDMDDLGD